jgi:tRNA dimethylallyltransferase
MLGITWSREELYRRIDNRVDARLMQGMVAEIQALLDRGVTYNRLDTLGLEYRFIARYLQGLFKDEHEMSQKLKYAIHDFARRQLSWFQRDKRVIWINGTQALEQAQPAIEKLLYNR